MLTDTHVHFDGLVAKETKTLDAVVEGALAGGVTRMVAMGGSFDTNKLALETARSYPAHVRAAVGYNPGVAGKPVPIDKLMLMLHDPAVAAVGEIGLDFLRGRDDAIAQIALFKKMLALARAYSLPVCVHTRAAGRETLAALKVHAEGWRGDPERIGVMHCFTGDEEAAREFMALGFFISFSGIITFKNAGFMRKVAEKVPAEKLLIETDSPYLAPEPFRGKPNEPANVRRVAETLAEIRGVAPETIAETTSINAAPLFFAPRASEYFPVNLKALYTP